MVVNGWGIAAVCFVMAAQWPWIFRAGARWGQRMARRDRSLPAAGSSKAALEQALGDLARVRASRLEWMRRALRGGWKPRPKPMPLYDLRRWENRP